jgi:predicted nucleotidyltransferase
VFGSQAKEDATEDSDVDIIVLLGQDYFRWPKTFHNILSQLRYDYYDIIDLDVHTKTRESLQRNPIFYNEVVNKGVFYGKS